MRLPKEKKKTNRQATVDKTENYKLNNTNTTKNWGLTPE
jgi:hypothetical protein